MARRKRKAAKRNEQERRFRSQIRRTCGGCKLCCYVYGIPELAKERRQWCKYVCQRGCSLHEQPRPPVCTQFRCLWLTHPEIPDRYRPDPIGCVAYDHGDRVVHLCQEFKGAALRPDASRFVDLLAHAGVKFLVTWEQGEESERYLRYSRRLYPTPLKCEDICRYIARFEQTRESQCAWQPEQGGASCISGS